MDRTLLQWEALRPYFLSEFEDDNSLGANTVTREVRLARKFDDPFSKLNVLFVQSVMPVFDHFNTFLQSEEPLVHLLHETTVKLYRALLRWRFYYLPISLLSMLACMLISFAFGTTSRKLGLDQKNCLVKSSFLSGN